MALFLLRHLTTRLGLTILAGTVVLSGCKTTSNRTSNIQSTQSGLPSDDLEDAVNFSDIVESEFNTLRENGEAEFLGCLCIAEAADKTKWVAWQFLKVEAKGYRTSTDKKIYDDLEACIAMRETLMECEG